MKLLIFLLFLFTGIELLKLKYGFGNCFWLLEPKCKKTIINNFIVIDIKLHKLFLKLKIVELIIEKVGILTLVIVKIIVTSLIM